MSGEVLSVKCCIVGGGPAGMMLGFLLARAGIDVAVLEKHADFLRDFRGDTIHPSTLEVMHELGLADELLKLSPQKAKTLEGQVGEFAFTVADFTHLPVHHPYIAFMPQWDFLNFLAARASRYPGFKLRMCTAATDLLEENGAVAGVCATGPDGPVTIRAALVVGADGRHSIVRQKAGLAVRNYGAPMDVLWFSLTRAAGDPQETTGRFDAGRIFIMIDRGAHWQCGYVIAKGSVEQVHANGLAAFQGEIAMLMPFAADRVGELDDWDKVKLLTVGVDRLREWARPGLLCIGDAAHTMSPVGGVGINLAIQDAVATANLLWPALSGSGPTIDHLRQVQNRRELPAMLTQSVQVFIQRRVIGRVLGRSGPVRPPLILKLSARFPALQRIPARMLGMGARPEHVRSPEISGAG